MPQPQPLAILLLLRPILRFLPVCVHVSKHFTVNHFLKYCEQNLLANFCYEVQSWTYLATPTTMARLNIASYVNLQIQ